MADRNYVLCSHEFAVTHHRLEGFRLRRSQLKADPVLCGGVVDPDAVAHEGGDVAAVGGPLVENRGVYTRIGKFLRWQHIKGEIAFLFVTNVS